MKRTCRRSLRTYLSRCRNGFGTIRLRTTGARVRGIESSRHADWGESRASAVARSKIIFEGQAGLKILPDSVLESPCPRDCGGQIGEANLILATCLSACRLGSFVPAMSFRVAFAFSRDPFVAGSHCRFRCPNPRSPHQRPRPPEFSRDLYQCVRASVVKSVFSQITDGPQQLARGNAKQRCYSRILQRSYREPAAFQRLPNPARDAGAEVALGVVEDPAPCVAALGVGEFR